MLETLSIRHYLENISSENMIGADNQQGSLRDPSETIRQTGMIYYIPDDIVRTL